MMGGDVQEPRVGVIILHYNRPDLATSCLSSLKEQTYPMQQVLMVDNGSEERLGLSIEDLVPAPHILHLDENLGFAGGVNAGLNCLREQGEVDFVWLLNNDVVCQPEVLTRLVEMLQEHSKMGAVSAVLEERQRDGRPVFVSGGKFPLPMMIPFVSKPGEACDYLCGACMLLRLETIDQVGPLDENYFFFFEDVDWCFRARRCGWELGVCEAGRVFHQQSSTIGAHHRLRAKYYRRSYIRFLRSYSKAPRVLSVFTAFYRLCADGVLGRWQACMGTWEGFWEGWREEVTDLSSK
ncbi:glycosyltransferase family 2 protein [Kiritimatiellota bacterium B12222]|nr:glycosyltransferase family 2 protein [Kiritimatiellota bacterium B12222]